VRRILIFCVCLGVLALSITLGPNAYRKWRSNRAYQNAEAAYAQQKDREALLGLRESLQSNPDNLAATRLMAGIMEKRHSPSSVFWQRRLSQLAPNEIEPRLAWLREAIALRDRNLARAALESFPPDQRNTALFHHLASSEALLRKDWKAAQLEASEADRLDPGNPVLELNLASVCLQSEDAGVVAEAQKMLAAMQQKEKTSVAATRVLIADALRRNNLNRAAELSRILLPSSAANFEDHLQYLTALEGLRDPGSASELKALRSEAGQDTGKNIRLVEWLLTHEKPAEAQIHLLQLTPVLLEDPLIRILRAATDAALGQWDTLDRRLKHENWEDNDYVRLAYLSRAAKESGRETETLGYWNAACKDASESPYGFYVLASTVQQWPHWEDETRDLLWNIADGYRYPVWALSQLHNYYLAKGDTRSLLRVAKRWKEVQPSDPVINNLAQYSLLMKQDGTLATTLARENYNRHPEDPAYVSTYAFALDQAGRTAEALKLMSQLKPEYFQIPEICAYQAYFLAKSGKAREAQEFRNKAKKAFLLPEEKELFEKAFAE